MTSVNTITGQNGYFVVETTRVARCTQWAVNPNLATKNEWGDSDSEGYTNRSRGRKDATFTAEGKYDSGTEVWTLFEEGDIVLAVLWLDAASLYYYFTRALCDGFNLVVNVDTCEVIGWTSSWGADGKYYRPGDPAAPAAIPYA